MLGLVHNMKFRKNWGAIWQDAVSLAVIVVICACVLLYAFINREKSFLIITSCAIFPVSILLARLLKPGILTDRIEIDNDGIALRTKDTDLVFRWEDVRQIIRTRYEGTNALAVVSKDKEMIWFYRNKKIEAAIVEKYPRARELFVNDLLFFVRQVRRNFK